MQPHPRIDHPDPHVTSTEAHPDILADRPDDPLSESLLLQAVRDGSTAAFGILYARYRPFAVGVATHALAQADVALAEDVAEVSFIRVLTALRNGKGPSDTLRSYLATTVRREAWRAQRRRRRQAEVVEQWAVGEERALEPETEGERPVGPGRDLGSHVLLGEAFRGLSDRWRHVLWLTAVEGRKPAEVAPMLGVSAGSASALAYRARNGLIAAYVAAYRRSTDDEACVAISARLEQYVAAGAPANGYADVLAHIDGCPACRDVSRGVDVLGSVLASMAPFGLLTAGLWAKTVGIGAVGAASAAGAAAAAGTAGAAHAVAGSATAATTATGGLGVGGVVAAAAAVTVLAGAAWFGIARADRSPSEAAAPTAVASSAPVTAPRLVTTPESRVSAAPTADRPIVSVATTDPLDPAPSSTTTASSTAPSSAPPGRNPSVPTTGPSTTRPTAPATTQATTPTSTTPSTSTSTTLPPVGAGSLSGRAVRVSPDDPDDQDPAPVSGVQVVAYDSDGGLAGTSATTSDGRWMLPKLPFDRYLVVAVVPATYRPATGPDPWVGGATWGTILGSVEVADAPLDLVDLRLVER